MTCYLTTAKYTDGQQQKFKSAEMQFIFNALATISGINEHLIAGNIILYFF
jgi:hypothetical protein